MVFSSEAGIIALLISSGSEPYTLVKDSIFWITPEYPDAITRKPLFKALKLSYGSRPERIGPIESALVLSIAKPADG